MGWDSESNPNLEITNLSLKKKFFSFQTYNAITTSSEFFLWRIFTIFRKIFSQRNILLNIPCCFGKKKSSTNQKKFKNCHNCLQYDRVLEILYFHIFNITFFLINILVDYYHLSNITKLKRKKILMPINVFWKISALQFQRSGNCVKNIFYTETHVVLFFLAQNREDLPPKKSLVAMYEMHFPICVSKP